MVEPVNGSSPEATSTPSMPRSKPRSGSGGKHRAGPVASGSIRGVAVALLLSQGLAICVSPLVARHLGAALRGQLALVVALNDASTTLFNAGIASAVGYFALNRDSKDDRALVAGAWRISWLLLPLSLVMGGYIAVAGPSSLDSAARISCALVVAVTPLVNNPGLVYRQLLLARRDLRGMRNVTLLVSLTRTIGLACSIGAGRSSLVVAIIASVGAEYVGTIYARRRIRLDGDARPVSMIAIVTFGLKALPGSLANFANARLDQLVIAPFVGVRDLGLYAVAVALNSIPLQLGSAISYRAFGVGEGDGFERYETEIRRSTVVAIGGCCMTAVAVFSLLVPVYGREYGGSLMPALLLLPGTAAFALFLTQQQVSVAIGRPGMESVAQGAAILLTAVGLVLVVPRSGIAGAAMVSTVAYIFRAIVMDVLLRKRGLGRMSPRLQDVVQLSTALLGRGARVRGGGSPRTVDLP